MRAAKPRPSTDLYRQVAGMGRVPEPVRFLAGKEDPVIIRTMFGEL